MTRVARAWRVHDLSLMGKEQRLAPIVLLLVAPLVVGPAHEAHARPDRKGLANSHFDIDQKLAERLRRLAGKMVTMLPAEVTEYLAEEALSGRPLTIGPGIAAKSKGLFTVGQTLSEELGMAIVRALPRKRLERIKRELAKIPSPASIALKN